MGTVADLTFGQVLSYLRDFGVLGATVWLIWQFKIGAIVTKREIDARLSEADERLADANRRGDEYRALAFGGTKLAEKTVNMAETVARAVVSVKTEP